MVKQVGGEGSVWRKEDPIHFTIHRFLVSIFLSFEHHIKAEMNPKILLDILLLQKLRNELIIIIEITQLA